MLRARQMGKSLTWLNFRCAKRGAEVQFFGSLEEEIPLNFTSGSMMTRATFVGTPLIVEEPTLSLKRFPIHPLHS